MILLSAADFPISYNVALCDEEEAGGGRQAFPNTEKFQIKPSTNVKIEK